MTVSIIYCTSLYLEFIHIYVNTFVSLHPVSLSVPVSSYTIWKFARPTVLWQKSLRILANLHTHYFLQLILSEGHDLLIILYFFLKGVFPQFQSRDLDFQTLPCAPAFLHHEDVLDFALIRKLFCVSLKRKKKSLRVVEIT